MRLLDNAVGRVCIALITAMALLITGVGFTSVANAADIPDFNPDNARDFAHFGLGLR